MKAVMLSDYCGAKEGFQPGNISVQEQPIPQPGEGEVQVKVQASSVNPVDWKLASGFMKGMLPFNFEKPLGFDVAGVVTELGEGATRLKVGDEVWGDCVSLGANGGTVGAYAEYVVVKESKLGLKPNSLTMQKAGVIPLIGLTAVQGVRICGDDSKSILILGGSAAVGMAAIQIAKASGKKVYTTCSTRNVEFVTGLGADEVIDYSVSDWGEVLKGKNIESVYDTVGEKDALNRAVGILADGGKFCSIGDQIPEDPLPRGITGKFLFVDNDKLADLDYLKFLSDNALLSIPVDKSFTLATVADAFSYSMKGKAVGKVAIEIV